MLIEKSLSAGDVASIKLGNGDEIIAKLVDQDRDSVIVTKPLLMVLGQDPSTGRPGISMAPFWMLGTDSAARYPIPRTQILCILKSNEEATKGYLAQTTGLTIPGSGSSLIT